MEQTVFFIFDNKLEKIIGYVATIDEAIHVIVSGKGKYSYNEVSINEIGEVKQTCYENIFE